MSLNLRMEVETHTSPPELILVCVDRLYTLANPFLLAFLPFGMLSIKNKNYKTTVNTFLYFPLPFSPAWHTL